MRKSEPVTLPTIDVFTLARSNGRIEGRTELSHMDRLVPLLASTDGGLAWELECATDPRGRPAASLRVRGMVVVSCDKCGLNLELPIDIDSEFWFVRTEAELNAQPINVDESEPLLGSLSFAPAQLVEDEVILALPISPRHTQCRLERQPVAEPGQHRALAALSALKSRH